MKTPKKDIVISLHALPRKAGRGASVYRVVVKHGNDVIHERKGRNRRDLMANAGYVLHNQDAY